jgi:hypothetical protein
VLPSGMNWRENRRRHIQQHNGQSSIFTMLTDVTLSVATREIYVDGLYAVRVEGCGLLSVIFGAGGGIVSFLKATKKLPLKKMRDSE